MHTGIYTLSTLVEITATPQQVVAMYCEEGLLRPVTEGEEPQFDDEALHQLRRLEFLRSEYGANVHGLRAICDLLGRLEELQSEVRFLRAGR